MRVAVKSLLLIILLNSTLEAGGFALSGVGSRALGMGGAFRAVSDDWTAIYWNPAGLSSISTVSLSFSSSYITPYASVVPKTGILGYDGTYTMRYKVNAASQSFFIPSFGFISPYEIPGGKLAFGFFVPFGLGSKWDLYDFPIGYYNTEDTTFTLPEYEKYDWQSDVKCLAFYGSISKSFNNLSIGLSLGPVLTKIYMRRINFLDPATINPEATSLPVQYRLFPIDTELEGTGWALGGVFGIMYQFTPELKAGASLRFYTKSSLQGKASLTLYFPRNDFLASQADSSTQFMFSGTTATGEGDAKTEIQLPLNAGLGISYAPLENLLLALDVDYTRWSSFDRIPVEFTDLILRVGGYIPLDTITGDTLIETWHNTMRYSFGFEYRLKPSLTLRGGIYYDETPVPDTTITPLIPDVGNKIGLNTGFTYSFKNIGLTMNYEYLRAMDRNVEPDENYDYKSTYFAGEYHLEIHTVGFGIEYKF